ncbi:DUF5312 domain-containing protein [Borrelia sp. BU AG58]|uniref:DUF5312 domain-containing protein n=1 Tax=Borrelia sp. BU AG58 TaxID=2887345 RepID=UPI001E577ECC|nr:DUF5312 domain-containing protein [Borrelia sp. BU AG58]UER67853.1 DUF5312 domain-containing protein [Borrelia sp. BU AG58]
MSKIEIDIHDSIDKLSKETRMRLIKEIKKNLSLNSSGLFINNFDRLDSDSVSRAESFLSDHLVGEPFLIRIWIYVLHFFQREVSREEIYKTYFLKNLENKVNKSCKNPVIDFKRGILYMGFVEMFFGFYRYSVKLKKFFKILDDRNVVEQAIFEVINSKIPNFEHKIKDFVDEEEYEKYLKKNKSLNELEDSIKTKINAYLNSIPLQTYKTVEDIFEFFYVLNSVAFFPYKSFFSFFDIEFLDDANLNITNFNGSGSASFESVDKYFNCFFDLLHTLGRIEVNEEILKIIVRNYFLTIDSNKVNVFGEEGVLKFDIIYKNVLSIMSKVISLAKSLPYLEIFKLYYKNPILQPNKCVSSLDLKSFYENILFLNVSGQIVRNHVMDLKNLANKEIKNLIKNHSVITELSSAIFVGLEIGYSNFKKLYFLNEFFKTVYDVRMIEVLKAVNNVVLVTSVEIRSSYVALEKGIDALRREVCDFYFKINNKNEEYERCMQEGIDDSCRSEILEWCLNESCYLEKLVLNFVDFFTDLRKKYILLLENNNAFIQSALGVSYKLSIGDNEKISLAHVISNVVPLIDQTLFILGSL